MSPIQQRNLDSFNISFANMLRGPVCSGMVVGLSCRGLAQKLIVLGDSKRLGSTPKSLEKDRHSIGCLRKELLVPRGARKRFGECDDDVQWLSARVAAASKGLNARGFRPAFLDFGVVRMVSGEDAGNKKARNLSSGLYWLIGSAYRTCTFSAWKPFGPLTTLNWTAWPS